MSWHDLHTGQCLVSTHSYKLYHIPELHSKTLTLPWPAHFCVARPAKLGQLELVQAIALQQEEDGACLSLHPTLFVRY